MFSDILPQASSVHVCVSNRTLRKSESESAREVDSLRESKPRGIEAVSQQGEEAQQNQFENTRVSVNTQTRTVFHKKEEDSVQSNSEIKPARAVE